MNFEEVVDAIELWARRDCNGPSDYEGWIRDYVALIAMVLRDRLGL